MGGVIYNSHSQTIPINLHKIFIGNKIGENHLICTVITILYSEIEFFLYCFQEGLYSIIKLKFTLK